MARRRSRLRLRLPWWAALLLILAALAWERWGRAEIDSPEAFQAPVLEVVDGDTVRIPGYTVRLYGVDAPEKDQPFGPQATMCLAALVWGRIVEVYPRDEDRYGRLVAVLKVGDREVNETLVARGCAWAYPKTGREYRDEERRAREQGLGLWSQPDPIPPWEWRRR